MPEDKKEPQSYGSGSDWLSGKVGETVNRQKGNPNSQHGDFYESRRDSEGNAPDQGGHVAAQSNNAESVRPSPPVGQEDVESPPKVKAEESGARRDSYFKRRDYE